MASLDRNQSGHPIKKNAFVHKLYGMLNNSKLSDLIWWSGSPEGHTFSLKPSKEFALALNGYFKHGNIASFVRQLHMYGFHKVSDPHASSQLASDRAPSVWEFRHSSGKFKKNDESSLAYIKRRSQSIPSRNPVIDNSLGPVNTHSDVRFVGPTGMSVHGMHYPKHYQPHPVPSLNAHHAYVSYPNSTDINGSLYSSSVVPAPQYTDSQGYYYQQNPHFTANSTFDSPLSHDSMTSHSGRSRANGGGFINSGNTVSLQPFIDNRNKSAQHLLRPSQQYRLDGPPQGHFQEGSSSQSLHGAPFQSSAFSPITAHKVSPGSESHLVSHNALSSRQVYESQVEAAQRSTPEVPSKSATNTALAASEGDFSQYTLVSTSERPASPFAPKPMGMSSLSSYSVMSNDLSATHGIRNEANPSVPGEATTSPTNFTFRRPFSMQSRERQRNPSLLFDPLTVVGKNSPRPSVGNLKGTNFDIKLPPLNSWQSPASKDQAFKDETMKQSISAESGMNEKFIAARQAYVLGNDSNVSQSRSNSQTAFNSSASKDRSFTAVHSNSLRDKIRPSLVNLHSSSQNSVIYPGIQHAKTVDSIASHSSSLFSNGSSISSASTNRSSFDSVSYRRKSSYTVSPHDEASPSPGFRSMPPGLDSPLLRHSERVGTISEEGSDSSTMDAHQGGAHQELGMKNTPSQEPKLEYLLHSASEESRKKQRR